MGYETVPDDHSLDHARLSHDLRTPLTVIRGYAELINRQLALPDPDLPRIAEMNAKLLAQVLRLEAVIRLTLDIPPDPASRHPRPADVDTQ